jgi:hypothetical protein
MRILKPSAWILLFGISFVLTASCGGDDDDSAPSAGKGGGAGHAGAGTAGKAGRGGSSSGAGEAGMTGVAAGGGGRSGSSHGGAAGEAASAGASGTNATTTGGTGAVSGTGGSAGSPEGGGPSSASAGMGGAGGESEAKHKLCSHTCEPTEDCATETFCHPDLHRCIECNDRTDCIPIKSAWVSTCTMDSDCPLVDFGDVCVDVGGRGFCAPAYDGTLGCLFPGEVPITLPKFGSSETIDVCGTDSGRCEDNRCFSGCSSEPDFCTTGLTSGYGDTCDEASGHCTCEDDGECTHGPAHCDLATHRCVECGEASHCAGAIEGKDVCSEGHCGCSSASVCTDSAPGGTPVCE